MLIRRALALSALTVVLCFACATVAAAASGGPRWHVSFSHRGGQITDLACSAVSSCESLGIGLIPTIVDGRNQLWRSSFRLGNSQAISCPGKRCLAVASFGGRGYNVRWIQGLHAGHVKHVGKEPYTELNGVSCPSTTDCYAVGQSHPYLAACTSGKPQHLTKSQIEVCLQGRAALLHWNGRGWTANSNAKLPPVASRVAGHGGTVNAGLGSVACSSSRACETVGIWRSPTADQDQQRLFAAGWNGHSWSIQPITTPRAKGLNITSLSCARASGCMLVGDTGGGRQKPFVRRFDGRQWTAPKAVIPAHLKGASFSSVSCVASGHCMVVGSEQRAHHPLQPLAELWDSGHWTVQDVPLPHTRGPHHLTSVVCFSATSCVAAGNGDRRIGIDDIFASFLERLSP